ncbi:MAG: tRNA-intron lyase [Halobacteria archaeon]
MDLELDVDTVRGGDNARSLYDSSGYGRPLDGGLSLSLVEAAYLLYHGDVDEIDGMDLGEFVAYASDLMDGFYLTFMVYRDLRERGLYLQNLPSQRKIEVYPRGVLPQEGDPEYIVRAAGEASLLGGDELDDVVGVLDDGGDVTYFEVSRWDSDDGTLQYGDTPEPGGGELELEPVGKRYFVTHHGEEGGNPEHLHKRLFYGAEEPGGWFLSPEEVRYLNRCTGIDVTVSSSDQDGNGAGVPGLKTGIEEDDGQDLELRLGVYSDLRDRGLCPKTGFKYGAEFRVYETVEDVEDLPHSSFLVQVLPESYVFDPKEVSRAARLAHGVKKTMVFALAGDGVRYLAVERFRP